MTPGSQRDVMSSITRSDDSDAAAADVAAADNLSYNLHITSAVTRVDGRHACTHTHLHTRYHRGSNNYYYCDHSIAAATTTITLLLLAAAAAAGVGKEVVHTGKRRNRSRSGRGHGGGCSSSSNSGGGVGGTQKS